MSHAPERRVVGPAPRSTPQTGPARARRWELPRDLQRQASRRLSFISLLTGVLWIVATILYHYVDRVIGAGDRAWLGFQPTDALVGIGAALSFAMAAYTRRTTKDPARVLDLGLVYMVVTAFIIGVILHWDTPQHMRNLSPVLSWIGVMVLLFAATLPNRPIKVLVAGALAVSMNPIGMLISRAQGRWPFEHAGEAWLMHYPDLMLVGIAAVIVRVVFNLSRHVAKARELGSYTLGALIGRGGMGEVYRATHLMLARPAAIKLMRPEMLAARNGGGAEMAEARFRREAEAAANLRSPHTVELYDFGVTEDGTMYFAMELLEGMDLESLVRQTGPMPAARVICILRQVTESLEEAHVRGLVHRDIKPANIHLGRLGLRHDFAKVLDFGLVTAPTGNTLATAAGVVPGTPQYMAPEMALGEPVDGRADLYSLGCVAHFLLTGRVVFEANGAMQTIVRRLHEDPPPASSETELPIPPALDALVLACLARRPSDRPATAGALRTRLESIPVEPWTQELAEKWWAANQPALTRRAAETEPSLSTAPTATA